MQSIDEIKRPKYIFWLTLVLMSLAGVVIILIGTRWGAAIKDDTYFYVKPARDVLAGSGFYMDPTFPPFLPLVLTGIGLFNVDPRK